MSLTLQKNVFSPNLKNLFMAGSLALGILIPTTFLSANAFDLGDGRTAFERAPRLIRTAASHSSVNSPSSYQFTIEVPEDAGEALKAVIISPKKNAKNINFDVSDSNAFIGDSFAGGTSLSLANIGGGQMNGSNEVTFVFDEPVEPGNTVTVSLKVNRNPGGSGVYLFGVTAFPEGENSPGLYLGSGRLHFLRD